MFNSSLHKRTSYSSEFDYNEFALYAAKKGERCFSAAVKVGIQ